MTASPFTVCCPACGASDVALDYRVTATLRMIDDVPQYVTLSDVLADMPEQIFCYSCDHETAIEDVDEFGELVDKAVKALPERVQTQLSNETQLYERT